MGRPLPAPRTRYYNNLVVGTIDVGIDAPEPGASVYQNTVVDIEGVGIRVEGPGSVVQNNIVAAAGEPLSFGDAVLTGNLIASTVDGVGFADPADGDYRLTSASSAVDVVPAAAPLSCDLDVTVFPKRAVALPWPMTDRDDRVRPSGCGVDLGAFEYGALPLRASRGHR
jgi:hypothetical protein